MAVITKYCFNLNALKPLLTIYTQKELAKKLQIHYVWLRSLVSSKIPPEKRTVGPTVRRKFLALYQSILGVSPDFDTLFQEVP